MSGSNDNYLDSLWLSFLNGDDKSFSFIYQRYINHLLSYGHKLSSDRELVHDCLQEVFMDLFLKRRKLDVRIENLKPYLFVALRNSIVKKITKNRKNEIIELNTNQGNNLFNIEYSHEDNLIETEISVEMKSKIKMAVNSLAARQKEIIYLKFEEELEYSEISEILKISVESARKLLYRALLSLRETVDLSNVF